MNLATRLADLRFSHEYAAKLIDAVPHAEWAESPGGVSCVAWQVGHLAMAQYRLIFERSLGFAADGAGIIPAEYLVLFPRLSVPGPAGYPRPAELREAFESVHLRALAELESRPTLDFAGPALTPHPICGTVGDCLRWASHHEMIHAGQIALLRRQLGHAPLW